MPDLLPRTRRHYAATPAEILRLDNGLTLIYQPLPTEVATVDVWLPAGAAVDPLCYPGMAHFLEHLIFKGTSTTRPGDFDALVENCGGFTNAATGYDYAHYYITTAAEQLGNVLPTFADLLLNAAIPTEEFERERQVVLEELRQAKDDPDWVGFQALMTQVYGREIPHPYGRPILGTEAHLQTQSPELLRQFHRHHYRPENMTVVVAGGVARDRTLDWIQNNFVGPAPMATQPISVGPMTTDRLTKISDQTSLLNHFNDLSSPTRRPIRSVPPTALAPKLAPQHTPPSRQVLTQPNLEQARLMWAWIGPGLDDPETATGLDLLTAILTDGRLSRLVKDLRESRRWVTDVESDYSCDRLGGLFTLTAWLEPEHLDAVEQAIQTHIVDLQRCPVDHAELKRAQVQLERDFIFSLETPEDFAELYGHSSIIPDLDRVFDYPLWVEAWTPQALQEVAQQYLSLAQGKLTILYPQESIERSEDKSGGSWAG